MIKCQNCGNELHDSAKFCRYCGSEVMKQKFCTQCGNRIASDEMYENKSYKSQENIFPNISQTEEDWMEEERLKPFVGKNEKYYSREFKKIQNTGKGSFNWIAFLFGPILCLYRKEMKTFLKFFAAPTIAVSVIACVATFLSFISEDTLMPMIVLAVVNIIGFFVEIAFAIVCGKKFNKIYFDSIQKRRQKGENYCGVSISWVIIGLVAFGLTTGIMTTLEAIVAEAVSEVIMEESFSEDEEEIVTTEESSEEKSLQTILSDEKKIDTNKEFIFEDSNSRYLTDEEVSALTEEEKWYALAEILARHGADFTSLDDGGMLKTYFEEKSWYNPQIDYELVDENMFNTYETVNCDLISSYIENEEDINSDIMLEGSYEMWIDSNGGADLEIVYYTSEEPNEDAYYATFSGSYYTSAGGTEGYLLPYTDGSDRIWEFYPDDHGLNEYGVNNPSMYLYFRKEGVNIVSLDGETFGGMYFPGFDGYYAKTAEAGKSVSGYILKDSVSRYLSEAEISHLSKEELRLARNEIYARHGRRFQTDDLNAYFRAKSWYQGYLSDEEFDNNVLNEYEKANLLLIQSVEREKNIRREIVSGFYVDEKNETSLSINMYSSPETNQIGYVSFDDDYSTTYIITDSDTSEYYLMGDTGGICGSLEVLPDNQIRYKIYQTTILYNLVNEYIS